MKDNLPVHIAMIPDGNGRWAKMRGLPRNVGHREGSNKLKEIVKYCSKIGIKYLTIYTFSTENWKRPKNEVDTLLSLLLEFLRKADIELSGSNIRIRIIGNIKGLPDEFREEIPGVEKLTENNTGLNLYIALNYGGRDEIINTVRDIAEDVAKGKLDAGDIDADEISGRLYTRGVPDPDLLIRTGGEKRASNFLLWQLAYTEFWYSDVLWPDFKSKHLDEAIDEYRKRNRRYGGII